MKKTILQLTVFTLSCLAFPVFSQAATLSAVNIKQSKGSTLVSGTVNRVSPAQRSIGAHIHVELVDAQGRTIDRAVRSLSVTAPRKDASRNYRASYSVRFDPAPSSSARVKYVKGPHEESC